jgi:hypothetical protein
MGEEIVIRLDQQPPKPGHPCPQCGGTGRNCDGSVIYSTTEIRMRPASKCRLCNGKGRVRIEPLPDFAEG